MTARVVVVGSINADYCLQVPRFPEAGETLLAQDVHVLPGGKGLNQAVAARRAGADVVLVGRVGDDPDGAAARAAWAAEGVRGAVASDPAGTGIAVVLVQPGGGNRIVAAPRANAAVSTADVRAAAGAIGAADVLLLQGEVPVAVSLAAARCAAATGCAVVFNPAPAPPATPDLEALLALARVVVVNETELTALAGEVGAQGAGRLRPRCGGSVVTTLGGRGACLTDGDHPWRAFDPVPVAAVDTVGAGDAFVGGLAVRLAEGAPLEAALRFAVAAGALAVTVSGALPSLPHRSATERLLRQAAG